MNRALSIHDQLADGPVGAQTSSVFVDQQIARAEGALQSIVGMGLTLEQIERLQRLLTRAHATNLLRLEPDLVE